MKKAKSENSQYLSLVDRTAEAVLWLAKTIPRDYTNRYALANGQVWKGRSYSLSVGYEGYPLCDPRIPLFERKCTY